MSGCSLSLSPSRWRSFGLWAVAGLPIIVLSAVPLSDGAMAFMAVLLLLFYWYWYQLLQRPSAAIALTITDTLELQWLPADSALSGKLLAGGLVSTLAILLRYQTAEGRICRCWILADQCSSSDFRALARQVNQANWPLKPRRSS